MTKNLSLSEARAKLTYLPEELGSEKEPTAIAITRRGKPVLAILPWDFYESLVETLEIMGDRNLMRALAASMKEIQEGKTLSHVQLKRSLDI